MTADLTTATRALLMKIGAFEPRLPNPPVTTALGNGGGTTVLVNSLAHRPDDYGNDTHWLILPKGPSGAGSLEVQRVSDFDQADSNGDTVITVSEPYTAQVSNGVQAYLSPLHPEDVRVALNAAGDRVYPHVHVPRRYHHVSKSRVFNGFFDFWTGTLPEWWVRSNAALTVTADYDAYFSDRVVKLVADGSQRFLSTQPVLPSLLNELAAYSVTLHALMRSTAASKLGLRIQDGAGAGSIVYHTGGGAWEEVVTAARTLVPGRPGTPIQFDVAIEASATGWVGPVWTEGGPDQQLVPIPPTFRRGPSRVTVDAKEWPTFENNMSKVDFEVRSRYPAADRAGTLTIGNSVAIPGGLSTAPRLMALEGEDYLSDASAQTDVFEVDPPYDELLYIQAIIELKRVLGNRIGSGSAEFQIALKRDWKQDYDQLLSQQGARMARVPVEMPTRFSPPAGSTRARVWNDTR